MARYAKILKADMKGLLFISSRYILKKRTIQMIRWCEKVFENYFIDEETAVITDKDGNVVKQYTTPTYSRPRCMGMPVHQIQAHTKWGYHKGWDVHHKDDDPFNNAVSNLEYIPHEKHASISHTGKQYKMTKEEHDEWVKKLSESHKGQIPVNKGLKGQYHLSEETRKKMSEARKGHPSYTLGRQHSEETKQKMRKPHLKRNV